MKRKDFGERLKRAISSEKAEAMPAAIVTAIISSMILLGIASAVSLVVQDKADSEGDVALTSVASNIDVSLRSDISQASYVSASAKLKQPTTGLITPTDVNLSGVNLHIPASTGECKVVRWTINGTTASRELKVYSGFDNSGSVVKCNETTTPTAQRTKVFTQSANVEAPFKFNNQVGREITFTTNQTTLDKVNTEYQKQLADKKVQRLTDSDFNELNKLLTSDSFTSGFKNPAACVMDATKINNVCPAPEAETVAAAWNSVKIAKVSVAFQMQSASGEVAKRDISQNATVPLYADAAEAEAAVADSSLDLRPAAPLVTLSTDRVILGSIYTIDWTAGGDCPANMVRSYKVYENNLLVKTQTTTTYTKSYTNSASEYVNYNVQTECVRGALIVNSDMSPVATAKVIPAPPALGINQQPPATNASLTAPIQATATCLWGTSPRYTLIQTQASYGTAGVTYTNLTSLNRAINNGYSNVVQGARYQYQVIAWCISAYDRSTNTQASTAAFTTLINAPTAPVFNAPANDSTNVSPTALVSWNPAVCAPGTTVKYYAAKNIDAGNVIAPAVIYNWTSNLNFASNNTQGNTVGYFVQARCEGSVAGLNSVSSTPSNVKYTTLINAPSPTTTFSSPARDAVDVVPNVPVAWTVATCAPSTNVEYYVTKNYDAGVPLATPEVIYDWVANVNSFTSNNAEGVNVGYTVAARCAGPNADSSQSPTDSLRYTTVVNAPDAPAFTSPLANATGVAVNAPVTWSTVTCAAGTSPEYRSYQTLTANVTTTPGTLTSDWSSATSFVSNNTQGNRVGYTVAARCVGPNAASAPSPDGTLFFTTTISAPNAVSFTSPADNATGVATNATLTWTAVTCATGTTAKYYSYKDMNAGAVIAPSLMDNWNTDTSYVSSNYQGYKVRYNVRARCDGPNVVSASTATDSVTYTTLVAQPAAVTSWNDGWSTVSWNPSSCATNTTIKYRVWQEKGDNGALTTRSAWTTGTSSALPDYNTGGYPQWASVEAICDGVNADSGVRAGANTTKWVKNFNVGLSGYWQGWRRVSVEAYCPFATSLNHMYLYVAADGWGGARTSDFQIQTDEGAWIAGAYAGGGGNTGWMNMGVTQNEQWNAKVTPNTTWNWGYWGNYGWGSTYRPAYAGSSMTGTYWNASGWGNWAYWWYGECDTPYAVKGQKGGEWFGGGIRNAGDPGTRYNAARTTLSLTQAGVDAIK